MIFRKIQTILIYIGTICFLVAAAAHWFRLDQPKYAFTVGETPIELHADTLKTFDQAGKKVFNLQVKNIGRKPFSMQGVWASCSCTVAGDISNQAINPGNSTAIPLQINFPKYGYKKISVTLHMEHFPPAEVELVLHAPENIAPAIMSNFPPKQFLIDTPGELVEYPFTIQTIENDSGTPWLTGMTSSHENSTVESGLVETSPKIRNSDLIQRTYHFTLLFIGPESPHEVLQFRLSPTWQSPPVKEWTGNPKFRCHLSG